MKTLSLAVLITAAVLVPVGMVLGYLPVDLTVLFLLGTAVTTNQITPRSGPDNRVKAPVASTIHIYDGTLCFYDNTGYLTGVAGGNIFAGVATDEFDNSAGGDGDLDGEVYIAGSFELQGSGFTQATAGAKIYAVDNYTVTTSAGSNSYIGVCTEYISTTKIRVLIDVGSREYA